MAHKPAHAAAASWEDLIAELQEDIRREHAALFMAKQKLAAGAAWPGDAEAMRQVLDIMLAEPETPLATKSVPAAGHCVQ